METLESDLGALQFKRVSCARNGDCWATAPQAGRELTLAQARRPSMDTLDDITTRRGAVCDLLVADEIGGMDGATVRRLEMIPEDAGDALSDFRTQGFWDHPEEHLNAFMLFGLSINLGRSILVFELRSDGQVNADALLYGARDADGSLRRTTKDPITISSYTNLSYRDALSFLRTKPDVSVLLYDRDARHFDPFVFSAPDDATVAPPPVERTTVDERAERERAAVDAKAERERAAADAKAARERAKAERERAAAEAKAERERAAADAKAERERAAAEAQAERERAKEQRERAAAEAKAEREKAKAEEREAREQAKAEARMARERVRAAETAAKAAEREAQTAERLAKAQEAAARASERAAKVTKRTQVPSQATKKRAAPPPKSTPKHQKVAAAAPPPAPLAPSRFGRKRSAPAAHVFEDDLSVAERVDRALKRRAPVLPPTIHGYSVPPFVVPGARVWAKALYVGQHAWFLARVIKVRATHPRIHVRFEEDAQGNTHKHALPEMDAYLFPADISPLA